MGVLAILVITGTTVATRAHGWKAVTAATATGAPAAPLLRMIRSRSSTYQQASGAVGPAWCAPSHSCTHHIGCLTAFCVCVCVWPQPLAVARANGAAIGSRVYVTGGYDGSYARSYLQIFDSVTSTWSLGPNMPSSMYYHSMAASNSKVGLSVCTLRYGIFTLLVCCAAALCCGGLPLLHLGAVSVRSRYIAVGASDPNAVRTIWGCFWENRSLSLRRRWKHKLIRTLKIQHGLGSHARTDYNDASSDSCPRRYRAIGRQHVVVWR